MLIIVDSQVGNIKSIQNMFRRVGVASLVSNRRSDIEKATKLVLPGVGAFDGVVKSLRALDLPGILEQRVVHEKVPLLGICVGMQILGHGSEEGVLPGFGWIDATCVRFQMKDHPDLKVPHMGWNDVFSKETNSFFGKYAHQKRFYFVHSYHLECHERTAGLSAHYGYDFAAAVEKNNILGVQFHPEKSHKYGMGLLRGFASHEF